jgi:nicotinate-nucleotide adenylyltransferase
VRAGIFGGTFDPPHLGHLILAEEAARQLHLDQVFWVLTPDPPHKRGRLIASAQMREQMVRANIARYPKFIYSDVDFHRPPPLYAVDTMKEFHRQLPGAFLAYIMGEDSLEDLPTWHTPVEFVAECDCIAVMQRIGREPDLDSLDTILPGLKKKTVFLKTPVVEISSSGLRQKISRNQAWKAYVDPAVEAIIQACKLYK